MARPGANHKKRGAEASVPADEQQNVAIDELVSKKVSDVTVDEFLNALAAGMQQLTASDFGVDKTTAQTSARDIWKDTRSRRRYGYFITGMTVVAVTGLVLSELTQLRAFLFENFWFTPSSRTELVWRLSLLFAPAAVTVALVVFLFKVMRVGERMALPPSWATDPDVARVLLGQPDADGLAPSELVKLLAALPQTVKGVAANERD